MEEEDIYVNVPRKARQFKDFEVEAPQRRPKVTVKKVAVVVVIVLLVIALVSCVGVIVHQNRASKNNTETMAESTTVSNDYTTGIKTTPNEMTTVSVPTSPNKVAQCDTVWELHGTKCYYFAPYLIKLPWRESRVMCQVLKGDLVKIESREEQEFLDAKLQTKMTDNWDKFWIGLTDSQTEGQWVWTDGSPLNPSLAFWADDDKNKEPDNWTGEDPEGEDCARMGQKPLIEGLKWWYDRSCQQKQRSICEKTAEIL